MSAQLVCVNCGFRQVLATGFVAETFTQEKKQNCADRLGWTLDPELCPECALDDEIYAKWATEIPVRQVFDAIADVASRAR